MPSRPSNSVKDKSTAWARAGRLGARRNEQAGRFGGSGSAIVRVPKERAGTRSRVAPPPLGRRVAIERVWQWIGTEAGTP
eukprot:scaffold3827_cov137-Isochrysis_galbana.AAC.3